MNLLNLLPQDTRTGEIISSVGMILYGAGMAVTPNYSIQDGYSTGFWVILCLVFGGIQLTSILRHPKIELVRVLMAWVTGFMWMYISIIHVSVTAPEAGIMFALSISNFVAFIINIATLRILWKP